MIPTFRAPEGQGWTIRTPRGKWHLVERARLGRIAAHGALWDENVARDRPTRIRRAERAAVRPTP